MRLEQGVRRRLTNAERRERIEAAALKVFAERGYAAVAVGELAAAAGVTRTVLYDHFPSKRALYLHLVETQSAAMLAEVGRGIAGSDEGRRRMRATISAYLAFAQSRPDARRLLIAPIPSGDAELDHMVQHHREQRAEVVARLLAPDFSRAGVPIGSPAMRAVVALLIAGVDGVANWWHENPDVTLEEATDAAYRLLWNGLPRFGESMEGSAP